MKQATSFGMKMNNQSMNQKDKVSFDAPFDFFDDVLSFLDDVAEGFGELTASVHEGIKEIFTEPSTPRERKARQIVNKYATKSFSTAATIGQIPFADAAFIANQQGEMVK